MGVKRKVYKYGEALVVAIPAVIADLLNLRAGDTVEFDLIKECEGEAAIIMKPLQGVKVKNERLAS